MRRLAVAIFGVALLCLLAACAPTDETSQAHNEAGGTIPWNRPEKWEGGGVLGSQMSSMQGGH